MLFDFIDRQIILNYYRKYPNGSWSKKNIIVSRFEQLKALKGIQKEIEKPFLWGLRCIDRFREKIKNSKDKKKS